MSDGKLSDDARAVAGAWFGLMRPGTSSRLRFGMVQSKPSDWAQAGLDELVAAGVISREDEPSGAVVYRPLADCHEHFRWMARKTMQANYKGRPLTQPISNAEGRS